MLAMLRIASLLVTAAALFTASCGGDDGGFSCVDIEHYDRADEDPVRSECVEPPAECDGVAPGDLCDDDACQTALYALCDATYAGISCSTLTFGDSVSVGIGCYLQD